MNKVRRGTNLIYASSRVVQGTYEAKASKDPMWLRARVAVGDGESQATKVPGC